MYFFYVFVVLCDSWFLLLLCFRLGFLLVTSESYFGLDVVYLSMLRVVCVTTTIIIGTNIGPHDKFY